MLSNYVHVKGFARSKFDMSLNNVLQHPNILSVPPNRLLPNKIPQPPNKIFFYSP